MSTSSGIIATTRQKPLVCRLSRVARGRRLFVCFESTNLERPSKGRVVLLPIKGSHGPPVPRGTGLWSRAAALLASSTLLLAALPAAAQNATWNLNGSGDFNTGGNWTPGTVPTGTAFFGASNQNNVSFSAINTTIGGWTFNAGASNYTFTISDLNSFVVNFAPASSSTAAAPPSSMVMVWNFSTPARPA